MHTVLLPPFDEYLVGYADRSAVLDPKHILSTNAGGGMLSAVIVIDGEVAGTWKRTLKKNDVEVDTELVHPAHAKEVQGFFSCSATLRSISWSSSTREMTFTPYPAKVLSAQNV